MKFIIELLFVGLFGSGLALYPNPNYKSVVISRNTLQLPSQPQEIYGLPQEKTPAIIYGLPSKTFDVDSIDLDDETVGENVPEKLSETYGVPQVPSTSYGVPVQRVAVPSSGYKLIKLLSTYGVPSTFQPPTFFTAYGLPTTVKPRTPSPEYGVPTTVKPRTPSWEYGVPTTAKPKTPSSEYGVPPVARKPSTEYGVSSEEYGLPKERNIFKPKTPSQEYGVPQNNKLNSGDFSGSSFRAPFNSYELPQVKVPATVYGLF